MKENFPNREKIPEQVFTIEAGLTRLSEITGIGYKALSSDMSAAIMDGCDAVTFFENKASDGNILITFIDGNKTPRYRYQYKYDPKIKKADLTRSPSKLY